MNKLTHGNCVVKVIIPAYNEEASIRNVICDIPSLVDEIIVVNNNSTDATVQNAQQAGATVLSEPKPGYGNACLKGIDYIKQQKTAPDIVVFLDGDYSDYPEELIKIIAPLIEDDIDFVIGSRVEKFREKGAMQPQQIFGNWLATFLMRIFFNSKFTDLGPFRAIKYDTLLSLEMEDQTYGWTVEMQLKILKQNYTYEEIPVKYRNRIGVSKVSGTLKGSIFAGIKILTWIFKYSFK
ncbi:glycosyltransferase family 2 protein [Flavobacteriaceae bacterium]|nr:glycosyltransferase family 2 protein [Flavobacteriaceae bacterium]MDC1472075.1 glycosyltransferase family 2 protein [Flavobacteriaceae bacterium]MDC1539757.1 glycosyltransferase family 2 protein [Flavobacteriaceae bacterium]